MSFTLFRSYSLRALTATVAVVTLSFPALAASNRRAMREALIARNRCPLRERRRQLSVARGELRYDHSGGPTRVSFVRSADAVRTRVDSGAHDD